MLYVDGDPIGHKEAASNFLNYNEMREQGVESFLALVYLAKDGGVKCCGHFWKYEENIP
jgi:hypothetical protein